MKEMFVFLLGAALVTGCAATKPQPGILGSTYEKLTPGPSGGVQLRWLKPGVDFSKYNKFMVDPISFVPADDAEANSMKDIDPEKLKALAAKCYQAFVNAIQQKYPVVAQPGPGVARIRFGVIDLKKSYPVFAGVTSVVPMALAITILKRPVTGSWTGGGSTVVQVLATDSMTNVVIGAGQEKYEAGFFERFTRYGQAEDAFTFLGERIVKLLDEVHGSK
jgi:Protein of unknown function (DUF3313)